MNKIQTENNQQDEENEGNYYLPCGSPFQNMRPMTPIDNMLWSILSELSDFKLGDVQNLIQNILYDRQRLQQQQQQQHIYDANRADCHDKVAFESITEKKEVKEVKSKIEVKEEVKIKINKDVEKEEEDDDDEDDDEEVSNATSGSESESEPDNTKSKTESKIESESKPKYEPKFDSNKTKSKQGAVIVDFSINSTFIFGKIVSIDEEKKAKVLLDDERIGYFPTNFKYYGEVGDKVRVSIKSENKDKKILILNFINKHFEIGDEVIGIISINDSNDIYVNVQGIKMASFPKKFTEFTNLKFRDGMKVSSSIFKTYDYKEKNTNKIVGIGANLTFISIIY
jgi:hypothetical protein